MTKSIAISNPNVTGTVSLDPFNSPAMTNVNNAIVRGNVISATTPVVSMRARPHRLPRHARRISPFWNLQAGVRREFRPKPGQNYGVLALERLAPYWFDVEASLFFRAGEVSGRVEAEIRSAHHPAVDSAAAHRNQFCRFV